MSDSARQTKSKRVEIRMSPDELAAIRGCAEASGLTVSAWIVRQAGLRAKTLTVVKRSYDASILRDGIDQLARVGSNLNQIARALNRLGSEAAPSDVDAASGAVDATLEATRRLQADWLAFMASERKEKLR